MIFWNSLKKFPDQCTRISSLLVPDACATGVNAGGRVGVGSGVGAPPGAGAAAPAAAGLVASAAGLGASAGFGGSTAGLVGGGGEPHAASSTADAAVAADATK